MVLGDSKSIPHTYTANALATESSLQPHASGAWTMGFCDGGMLTDLAKEAGEGQASDCFLWANGADTSPSERTLSLIVP